MTPTVFAIDVLGDPPTLTVQAERDLVYFYRTHPLHVAAVVPTDGGYRVDLLRPSRGGLQTLGRGEGATVPAALAAALGAIDQQ